MNIAFKKIELKQKKINKDWELNWRDFKEARINENKNPFSCNLKFSSENKLVKDG